MAVQPSECDAERWLRAFTADSNRDHVKQAIGVDWEIPIGHLAYQYQEPITDDWIRYYDFALIELDATVAHANFVVGLPDGNTTLQSIYTVPMTAASTEKDVHAISRSAGYRTGTMKYMRQEGSITINRVKHDFEFERELCVKLPCEPGDSGGLVYFGNGTAVAMLWGGSREHDIGFVVSISEIIQKARESFGMQLELC